MVFYDVDSTMNHSTMVHDAYFYYQWLRSYTHAV